MSDFITTLPLADVGYGVIVTVVVGMILTGRLVPRSVLEDVRTDRDARIKEAMEWKEAWDQRGKTLSQVIAQNNRLLELSETSAHVLTSLPAPEGGEGDG